MLTEHFHFKRSLKWSYLFINIEYLFSKSEKLGKIMFFPYLHIIYIFKCKYNLINKRFLFKREKLPILNFLEASLTHYRMKVSLRFYKKKKSTPKLIYSECGGNIFIGLLEYFWAVGNLNFTADYLFLPHLCLYLCFYLNLPKPEA